MKDGKRRQNRGYKQDRKDKSDDGDHAHRAKVIRRKESRDRRAALLCSIMRRVKSASCQSKLRCAVGRCHNGFTLHGNYDGLCRLDLLDDGTGKTVTHTPWDKVTHSLIERLADYTWEPVRPKSPLEWLAEAANE